MEFLQLIRQQAMKAYGSSDVWFETLLLAFAAEVNGHLHVLAALPPEKETAVPVL
jgi:hypothetical protein